MLRERSARAGAKAEGHQLRNVIGTLEGAAVGSKKLLFGRVLR